MHSWKKERAKPFLNFLQHVSREGVKETRFSFFPGDAFHMIGKDNAADLVALGNPDLERVALGVEGYRGHYGKSHNSVVVVGRENHSRPISALLMARHRIEIDLYDVAPLGIKDGLAHQASSPTGLPQSVSGWMLSSVTPESRSSSAYFHFLFD